MLTSSLTVESLWGVPHWHWHLLPGSCCVAVFGKLHCLAWDDITPTHAQGSVILTYRNYAGDVNWAVHAQELVIPAYKDCTSDVNWTVHAQESVILAYKDCTRNVNWAVYVQESVILAHKDCTSNVNWAVYEQESVILAHKDWDNDVNCAVHAQFNLHYTEDCEQVGRKRRRLKVVYFTWPPLKVGIKGFWTGKFFFSTVIM